MRLAFTYDFAASPSEALREVPNGAGIIRFDLADAPPYVGHARNLRRRLPRLHKLFGDRIIRADYQPVGSSFEAKIVLWQAGREAWPEDYRVRLRLRPAVMIKALQKNRFPRLSVTTRIAGEGLRYGPFRSRVFAERFEEALLDFFQVRRCSENLEPALDHPGCLFGEIGKCLRPCQQAATDQEYHAEFGRLLKALESGGTDLISSIEAQRDAASEQLNFEQAKALHERAMTARKLFAGVADACDLDRWHGVSIQRGSAVSSIALVPIYGGFLQQKIELQLQLANALSLDQQLRESIETADFQLGSPVEREDSMALIGRWLFSSWRDGEFLPIPGFDRIPYRKLVNAVSRVAQGRSRS